ncbi:MAG: InlB B-repeat-containing protein [Clostridia bacterium]|nr:InlB B-repeat-containing protein [Clostridia bacterium]
MNTVLRKTKSIISVAMVLMMLFSNASIFMVTADDGLTCTVTFNAVLKATTDVPETVTAIVGGKIQIPANTPECEGWAFVGWNESGSAVDPYYIPGQYITVYGDMILKAAWRSSTGDGQYPNSGGYYSVYYSANGGTWTDADDSPYRKPTLQAGHMTKGMIFSFPTDTKTLSRDGYRLQTDPDDMNVVSFYSGDGKGATTYGDIAANNGYEYVIYPSNYKGSVFMVDTDRVPYGKNAFVYAVWDPVITYNMNDGTDTVISDFNYITDGDEYTVLGVNGYTGYSSSSFQHGREGDDKNTLLPNRDAYRGLTQIYSRLGYVLAGWNTAPDGSGTTYEAGKAYDVTEPLSLYAVWEEDPNHTHEYTVVVLKEANCTDRGRIEYTCACGKSYVERPLALGHDYSAWTVGETEQSRSCYRCGMIETTAVDTAVIPGITVNGYELTITNADKVAEVTYTPGKMKTVKDIELSADAVTVSVDTDTSEYRMAMAAAGIYTFAVKLDDSSVYIFVAEVSDELVSADGVTVTVKGLEGAKDFFIAKGDYDTYADVKANRVVNVTSKKFTGDSYSYVLATPGIYTVLIRSNDTSVAHKIAKINVTVVEPEFVPTGLQLKIKNLEDVKVIRTAYGEYTTATEIKRAEGARAFTDKAVIKGASEYTIQYRENGTASVIVFYNNGYVKVYQFEVKKTLPDFNHEKDTVRIGELDNLQVVRYASGEYTSASELKRAPDCISFTKHDVTNGFITVSGLKPGTYTFLVQYKDESYNFYTVTVTPEEPTASGISLSNAFSSNMIVQRDEKLTVWGGSVSENNEGKAVVVEFKGETAVGIVKDGIWEAVFDTTFPVDRDGSDMVIKAADGQIVLSNVLVGDVYYVIGQSNVFYGIGDLIVDRYYSGNVNNYINIDYDNARDMRFYRISSTHYTNQTGVMAQGTATLYEDVYNGAQWQMPSDIYNQVQTYAMPFINNHKANDNITCGLHTFSALGYMFAYNMTNRTDVPVGVIEIDASGYPLMAFAPNELAEKWGKDVYDAATGTYYYSAGAVVAPQIKTRFAYNQQIYPLHRFSIAGIIWYQGESDFPNTDEYLGAGASSFREELTELMTYFRSRFGNSDFPVYMVEFAPCFAGTANAYMDMGSSRCELGMVPSLLENSYVASTSDLWKTVKWINNIHPPIKDLNAFRITDLVLATKFGQGNIDDVCGPTVNNCEFNGNTVTVTFDHVSTGLKTASGNGIVSGVEIMVNGVWTFVSGDFIRNGNQLVITADGIITGVRYNRNTSHTFPEVLNLCNGYNMPAVAFVQYKY